MRASPGRSSDELNLARKRQGKDDPQGGQQPLPPNAFSARHSRGQGLNILATNEPVEVG